MRRHRHHLPLLRQLQQRHPHLREQGLRLHHRVRPLRPLHSSCEGSSFANHLSAMPVIPTATLSQLNYNRYLVPPNPPALPSLPPAHPVQPGQPVQPAQPVQPVQPVQPAQPAQPVPQTPTSVSAFSQNVRRSQRSSIFPSLVNQPPAPSTPPSAPRIPLLVTPPLVPLPENDNGNPLFPVPSRPSVQPPPEPVIRPQPVLQLQQVQVANSRTHPFFYPRYIAKVSLMDDSLGQIVSKFKIPGGPCERL